MAMWSEKGRPRGSKRGAGSDLANKTMKSEGIPRSELNARYKKTVTKIHARFAGILKQKQDIAVNIGIVCSELNLITDQISTCTHQVIMAKKAWQAGNAQLGGPLNDPPPSVKDALPTHGVDELGIICDIRKVANKVVENLEDADFW